MIGALVVQLSLYVAALLPVVTYVALPLMAAGVAATAYYRPRVTVRFVDRRRPR